MAARAARPPSPTWTPATTPPRCRADHGRVAWNIASHPPFHPAALVGHLVVPHRHGAAVPRFRVCRTGSGWSSRPADPLAGAHRARPARRDRFHLEQCGALQGPWPGRSSTNIGPEGGRLPELHQEGTTSAMESINDIVWTVNASRTAWPTWPNGCSSHATPCAKRGA